MSLFSILNLDIHVEKHITVYVVNLYTIYFFTESTRSNTAYVKKKIANKNRLHIFCQEFPVFSVEQFDNQKYIL